MTARITFTSEEISFETLPGGIGWRATFEAPTGPVTATGATMDDARRALQELLSVRTTSPQGSTQRRA